MRSNGKKIRFGVLSTARIEVKKVIPAMQKGAHTEVVAIASRSLERGREVAHNLDIPRWYGSYEALLEDPDLDAVYIPCGALMDIGCYATSLSRWLFNAEPQRVFGLLENDPCFGVDRLASASLDFGVGNATCTCSTQVAPFQRAHVAGTEGHIELSQATFNPPNDRPCVVSLMRGGKIEQLKVEVCDQYGIMADRFAEAILNRAPVPVPLEDAVCNLEVIDAIVASGCSGSWVRPGTAHLEPDLERENRTEIQSGRDDLLLHAR